MKLGLVLECDTGGPDELVLTCLARRLNPKTTVQSTALGSKKQVFLKGVEAAQELVESSSCDLVLIVWDLKPYWEEVESKNCEAEAADLRSKVAALPKRIAARIRLLCLTWELETWLIADARAVNAHLSTDAHKSKFKCKAPLGKCGAKVFLDGECKRHRGSARRYIDYREAIQIAKLIPDTARLRKIPSFARFSNLITNGNQASFRTTGAECDDLVYSASRLGRP